MNLSDTEIMMIEQIMYIISKDKLKPGLTIGQILESYTPQKIENMRNNDNPNDSGISPRDKAAMIEYMQNNENISSLRLSDNMLKTDDGRLLGVTFTQDGNSSEAIVAFGGTTGESEWGDNMEGMNVSDTQSQKDALEYVENLPQDNITVVGHSKGGNKAMYVAITSDKVNKCISMDGQGFSQEFMDKYSYEIEMNAGKITNYSLSRDYIHALMYQIPGSAQVYCEGQELHGDNYLTELHSPNSYFDLDENGKIVPDENGKPKVVSGVDEDPVISKLHQVVNFILNNADDSQKAILSDYLQGLIVLIFPDNGKASVEKIIAYILSHPDETALLFAFLVKYADSYGGGDVTENLSSFLIDDEVAKFLGEFYNSVANYIKGGDSIILKWLRFTPFYIILNKVTEDIDASKGRDDYKPKTTTRTISGMGDFEVNVQSLRATYEELLTISTQLANTESELENARKTIKGMASYLILGYKIRKIKEAVSREKRKLGKMCTAVNRAANIYESSEKKNLNAI